MSTRCGIGIQKADGSIHAIYCHNDGYCAGVGTILADCYKSAEQVNALLELGDISSLGGKIAPEAGQEHSWTKPLNYVTVAYHRDRDRKKRPNRRYTNAKEYISTGKRDLDADYLYLYIRDEWFIYGLPKKSGFVKINNKI